MFHEFHMKIEEIHTPIVEDPIIIETLNCNLKSDDESTYEDDDCNLSQEIELKLNNSPEITSEVDDDWPGIHFFFLVFYLFKRRRSLHVTICYFTDFNDINPDYSGSEDEKTVAIDIDITKKEYDFSLCAVKHEILKNIFFVFFFLVSLEKRIPV